MTTSTRTTILLAAALTFVADGALGIGETIHAGVPSPVTRFFQGIASVLLGRRPDHGGTLGIVLGVVMHFAVALWWSGVFALLMSRWRGLRALLESPGGQFKVAALYGPLIWTSMSFVVIASLLGRWPTITGMWWFQFFGHILSAGLPIAWTFRARR